MTLKPLAIALVHYPVLDRRGDTVTSAVTNLDIHDLARLATSYAVSRFYLVTPAAEQQTLVARITAHWQEGAGADYNPDRRRALDCLKVVDHFAQARADWRELAGEADRVVLTGAGQREGLSFEHARRLAVDCPLLLVFGTGHGLAPQLCREEYLRLAAVRDGGYNHLSVRTAAAIVLDRLVGEQGRPELLP